MNSDPTVPSVPHHTLQSWQIPVMTVSYTLRYLQTLARKPGLLNQLQKKETQIDIDLGCILYDRSGTLIDLIWFKNMRDDTQAIRHRGDSIDTLYREEREDDEQHLPAHDEAGNVVYNNEVIDIALRDLAPEVAHIALVLTSFHDQPISQVGSGLVHVLDNEGNHLLRLDLTMLDDKTTGYWLASLTREAGTWLLTEHAHPLDEIELPKIADIIAEDIRYAH